MIIDVATRYCIAKLISNKNPDTIIKCFFSSWLSLFGAPKKILTDNGGEFSNDEMRELGEKLNIVIKPFGKQ